MISAKRLDTSDGKAWVQITEPQAKDVGCIYPLILSCENHSPHTLAYYLLGNTEDRIALTSARILRMPNHVWYVQIADPTHPNIGNVHRLVRIEPGGKMVVFLR